MRRRAAKELLHIEGWLDRVDEVASEARTPISTTICCRRPATR
jgi:hypothetical protein